MHPAKRYQPSPSCPRCLTYVQVVDEIACTSVHLSCPVPITPAVLLLYLTGCGRVCVRLGSDAPAAGGAPHLCIQRCEGGCALVASANGCWAVMQGRQSLLCLGVVSLVAAGHVPRPLRRSCATPAAADRVPRTLLLPSPACHCSGPGRSCNLGLDCWDMPRHTRCCCPHVLAGVLALGGGLHGGLLLPGDFLEHAVVGVLYRFCLKHDMVPCVHSSSRPVVCAMPEHLPPSPALLTSRLCRAALAAARWASSPTCAATCGSPSPKTATGEDE